jgi:hypothetical protein
MDLTTVAKEKAKTLGIKTVKKNKVDLIRDVQKQEGNSPCFKTEIAVSCGLNNCLWRQDCVRAS